MAWLLSALLLNSHPFLDGRTELPASTKRDITVEKVALANDGILSVSLFCKWTYADTKLNLLSDQPFDSAWTFGESVPGLGKVMLEGKICWIDKSGKLAWDGRKLTKWDPDAGKLLP